MTALHALVRDLGHPEILVLGDLILDRYVFGAVDRISPEGPIPVLLQASESDSPGGAANVATNLAAMGAKVRLAGLTGKDQAGRRLISLVRKAKVNTDLCVSDDRPTSVKSRFLSQGHQLLRVDEEETHDLAKALRLKWKQSIKKTLSKVDLVVLSDYAKGVLSPEFIKFVVDHCKAKKIPVLVDPKGRDYKRYRGATLVTPNLKECAAASGMDIHDEDSLLEAARELLKVTACQRIIVTRGAEGMSLITRKKHVHQSTLAPGVYDVSGAGDSSLAALAMGWASQFDPVDCMHLANLAGGIAVSRLGAGAVSREDLDDALDDEDRRKLVDRENLKGLRQRYRQQGLKVVLTTGCFDILHSGHLSLLREARAQGDVLVVGINSDNSVRRLKGPERPLTMDKQRAHLLAGFAAVDHVVVFNEDSPRKLIESLCPDIWVKGGDYEDAPAGSPFARELEAVKKGGGQLHLARFVDGQSTTRIVNKIKKK